MDHPGTNTPLQSQTTEEERMSQSHGISARRPPRSRPRKAYYLCSMRKVRCDIERIQPYTNYVVRSQASLCTSGPGDESRSHPHTSMKHKASNANGTVSSDIEKAASAPRMISSPPFISSNATTNEIWAAGSSAQRDDAAQRT